MSMEAFTLQAHDMPDQQFPLLFGYLNEASMYTKPLCSMRLRLLPQHLGMDYQEELFM